MAGKRSKVICAAIAAAILTYQLFAPGFAGLADNGDFPRVAGRFSLCPAEGWDASRFRFFIAEYKQDAACYWDSGVPTSSLLLTHIARGIWQGPAFPIRASAAVHSAILIALIAAWPPLLIFTDFANTAYFNSFYLEGFALLALMAVAVTARNLLRHQTNLAVTLYAVAAIFLITSKLQHATLSVPLAGFLIWHVRWRAIFPAMAMLLCAVFMSTTTPESYKLTNLWNSVFVGLVPQSPTAISDLRLSPAYLPYTNRNAYEFPTPQLADYWETRFGKEMNYWKLASYYARYPVLAGNRILASAQGLNHPRPDYLGNTPPVTQAFTQSHRVDVFSSVKASLFRTAPYLAIVLYAALGFFIPRSLALLLLSMAAIEFLTSTFADSVLDYRHHALLQQLLDVWLLCAATSLVSKIRRGPFRTRKSQRTLQAR